MTTFIGYGRVSSHEQILDLQMDALTKAGVEPEYMFLDKVSGARDSRPQLDLLKRTLRKGDVLVVWKLDRLGRSVVHLANWLVFLMEKGIDFKSITEGIDTTTPGGRLIYHMMAAVAQFERDLVIERTKAGLEAARARGRMGGRKKSITQEKLMMAIDLLQDPLRTVPQVAEQLNVGASTLYRDVRLYRRLQTEIEAEIQDDKQPGGAERHQPRENRALAAAEKEAA